MRIRTYSDLRRIQTFEERFTYLSLRGQVGRSTFGFDRWVNQTFYTSRQWREIRQHVILRDEGCDLAVSGYDISSRLLIHHMNPISIDDIVNFNESILDPEFLITTTHDTHNAIHYGDESLLRKRYVERSSGDTKLW
jgi:hypothetical protein